MAAALPARPVADRRRRRCVGASPHSVAAPRFARQSGAASPGALPRQEEALTALLRQVRFRALLHIRLARRATSRRPAAARPATARLDHAQGRRLAPLLARRRLALRPGQAAIRLSLRVARWPGPPGGTDDPAKHNLND